MFKELWATHRDEVVAFSGRRGGPIFTSKEPHKQYDVLDETHYLFMGYFPQYMLAEVQHVLDELNLADELVVKYSEDAE